MYNTGRGKGFEMRVSFHCRQKRENIVNSALTKEMKEMMFLYVIL